MRKRETKFIVPFCSVPNRCVIENSIKIVKNSTKKKKKYDYGSFQAKIGRRRPRKTENKSYRSVSFQCGTKQKIKKNSKKIQKIKKYHYEFISNQNKWEKDEKEKIGRAHV